VTTTSASRPFDLAVVGLGFVGLPLAHDAIREGLRVVGYDTDPGRVASINQGHSSADGLDDRDVATMLAQGFAATTDPVVLEAAETIVICVPTPVSDDRRPNLTAVLSAAQDVADHLQRGTLVTLESTTYPGTTEEVMRPILESGGLRVGTDFNLAFAPERINPGSGVALREIPRVVGGVTASCTEAAMSFYGRLVDRVVPARSSREAEMSKLIENTYRQVNIAMVNELATICRDLQVDVWDAISCAASKPYGYQPFWPGAGVGGHCIPVDPHYLTYKVRTVGATLRMAELADDINRGMPAYVVHRAMQLLNTRAQTVQGSSVLLLGVSYKPNVCDLRGTPALPIATQLMSLGAEVRYHDPHVEDWTVDGKPVSAVIDLEDAVAVQDLVVLLQRHDEYDDDLLRHCNVLFDATGTARDCSTEVL
jgi:nucleotide sugar dehydrogenase